MFPVYYKYFFLVLRRFWVPPIRACALPPTTDSHLLPTLSSSAARSVVSPNSAARSVVSSTNTREHTSG